MNFKFTSILLFVAIFCNAATYTSNSTTVGDWDIAGTPGSSDDIVINHDWSSSGWTDADVTSNFAGTITINSGGYLKYGVAMANLSGTVTVKNGGTFYVNGSFTDFGGDFDIQAGGTMEVNGDMSIADEAWGGSFNLNGYLAVQEDFTNELNSWTGSGELNTGINGCPPGGCSYTDNGDVNGTSSITLPVELSLFTSVVVNENVLLKWETNSEVNNDFFEVQKSIDGQIFTTIGRVEGKGNSFVLNKYTFNDKLENTSVYYRLKQVDFNGSYTFSHIINVGAASKDVQIVQNNNSGDVYVLTNTNEEFTVAVYDIAGKEVYQSVVQGVKGGRFNFDFTHKGMLMVSVGNNRVRFNKKVVVR